MPQVAFDIELIHAGKLGAFVALKLLELSANLAVADSEDLNLKYSHSPKPSCVALNLPHV